MDKHLYFSLIPEALIASQLPPEKFGQYYATGYGYKSKGEALFIELDPTFRDDFFAIDEAWAKCEVHPDGRPKNSVYVATYRVLEQVFSRFGLEATFVDTSNLQEIEKACRPNTRALFIETPTNPLMKIADIRGICDLVKPKAIQVIVDNTFLSPYLQRPLALGADIVLHSGSKYLSGHNDVICGLVTAKEETLCKDIGFIQNSTGAVLGPQDSWLLLRGIKTLALRMNKHGENALTVAQWLKRHPKVKRVFYPGLEDHPGKDIQEAQASGHGGMLSFEVVEPDLVPQVLRRVKTIQFAESLGGVESLITFPMVQTHADVPLAVRERLGISDCLLRMSVGIEAVEDIIADLAQGLE